MKLYGVQPILVIGTLSSVTMLVIAGTFPSFLILAISFSFMGLGTEQLGTGSSVIVQQYFDKRRSLASGVLMSGFASGTFIWPPLIRFLIDKYTWRGTFYIIAGIYAQTFILALLLRPPPPKDVKKKLENGSKIPDLLHNIDNDRSNSKMSILKYFTWALYIICLTTNLSGHFVPMNFYPMKGKDEHMDKHQVPLTLSVMGAIGIFVRPVAGHISDRFINCLTLATISSIISGVVLGLTALVHTFPPLMAIGVILGITQSFYIASFGAQWVDVFGLDNIELGTGLSGFAIGFSSVILNPVAGALIDLTGTTDILFYVFGGVQIVSGITLIIVRRLILYQKGLITVLEMDIPLPVDAVHSKPVEANNGDLYVNNGDLHVSNGDLYVKNGDLHVNNGELHVNNEDIHEIKCD